MILYSQLYNLYSTTRCSQKVNQIQRIIKSSLSYQLDVIYEDNHLLIVNKPPCLLSQGDNTQDTSIVDIAKDYLRQKYQKMGNIYLGLIHRLDRPCSGILCLAKTSKAAARISESFQKRSNALEKKYICVVNGNLQGSNTLNHLMSKSSSDVNIVKVFDVDYVNENIQLYAARLSYESLLSFIPSSQLISESIVSTDKNQDNSIDYQSLLLVTLETGRKHQIRAQLSYIGHPIIGDVKYSAKQRFLSKDIALHAYSLSLTHPITKEKVIYMIDD